MGDGMAVIEYCDRPPLGWACTRRRDHDGPCAARPVWLDRNGERGEVPVHASGLTLPWWVARRQREINEYLSALETELGRLNAR